MVKKMSMDMNQASCVCVLLLVIVALMVYAIFFKKEGFTSSTALYNPNFYDKNYPEPKRAKKPTSTYGMYGSGPLNTGGEKELVYTSGGGRKNSLPHVKGQHKFEFSAGPKTNNYLAQHKPNYNLIGGTGPL